MRGSPQLWISQARLLEALLRAGRALPVGPRRLRVLLLPQSASCGSGMVFSMLIVDAAVGWTFP